MMPLLPTSTNADYHGARSAVVFLFIWGLGTLIPGMIHAFLPDGGSVVIAGLDVGNRGELVASIFAWMGGAQIAMGLATLLVAWRHQPLTPVFIVLALLERSLVALRGWVLRPPLDGHHPPEHYVTLIMIPVALLFLVLSLRDHRR